MPIVAGTSAFRSPSDGDSDSLQWNLPQQACPAFLSSSIFWIRVATSCVHPRQMVTRVSARSACCASDDALLCRSLGRSFREAISGPLLTSHGAPPTVVSWRFHAGISHCSQGSRPRDSFKDCALLAVGSLDVSNGLMSGSWREFQGLSVSTSA